MQAEKILDDYNSKTNLKTLNDMSQERLNNILDNMRQFSPDTVN
jgi:hypothetical protein